MIVDSSALLAIVFREEGWERLLDLLMDAPGAAVGTPTLAETGIVLEARVGSGARGLLERLLDELSIQEVPFGEVHWREATDAFRRFGKGRHPAGLNFGDCMTYAVARLAGEPLLFVGDDFKQTDLDGVDGLRGGRTRTAGAVRDALRSAPLLDEATLHRLDSAQVADTPPENPRLDD